jgi:signal transduction histidine kinase
MPDLEGLYERLRQLAVEDPAAARRLFLTAFEANSDELSELLSRLARPGEGRLRQVIANAVRRHPKKARIVAELMRWRETETDEFTRRAIEGALADVPAALRDSREQEDSRPAGELASVYRYVSSRLRHRLRNAMFAAQTQAERLSRLTTDQANAEVHATVVKFKSDILLLARELEATNRDPEHFRRRPVVLADWIRQLNLRYSAVYMPVNLRLMDEKVPGARIFASDYLLEIIFWNIWMNAQQAASAGCDVTVEFRPAGRELELLISDNGDGFSPDLKDIVFEQVYSSRQQGSGIGMLEIQDAVEQLGGRVELYRTASSEYRMRIRLRLEFE